MAKKKTTEAKASKAKAAKLKKTPKTKDAADHDVRQPQTEPSRPESGKLSALDAAAKVLAEAGKPMNCKELIGLMAAKGYWSSPGGKTPWATLYSALTREITTSRSKSRFRKAGPGLFGLADPA